MKLTEKIYKQHLRLFVIGCLLMVFTQTDAQVRFYAKSDARKIVQGSYVSVEFVLENASGSKFTAPAFDGFERISGPNASSKTSIFNGAKTTSRGYSYTLAGNNIGRYVIGPATIFANGKIMKTQPITIEVLKGSDSSISADKKSMVLIELSDSVAYIGQQILLDYKLVTTEDVINYNIDRQPDFDGFYVQEVSTLRSQARREVINGVEYKIQVLKRYALFPQQTGNYTIEKSNVTLGISTGRRSNSFFFSQQTRPYRTITNSVNILVDNVPRNAPDNFSGAVGSYQMSANAEKRSITTDEALTINMEIVGDGDNRMVLAPKWKIPEGMELYDPNILEEKTYPKQSKFLHKKKFEYLLVAENPGRYQINPSFSYYDVEKREFVELSAGPFQVNVLQGQHRAEDLDLEEDRVELHPIQLETSFSKKEGEFYSSLIHKGTLGILLLALLGIYLQKRRLEKLGQLDPKYFIQMHAKSKALDVIDGAKEQIKANEGKKYYEIISVGFKNYLEERFEIPAVHLKKEELEEQLLKIKPSPEIIESIEILLNKSEQALYAPISITDMEKTHSMVIDLINHLDEIGEEDSELTKQ